MQALRTETLRANGSGKLSFGFEHTVALPIGNRRALLSRAMRARDKVDSDVYFTLNTLVKRERKELGAATLNLCDLLRDGRDARDVRPKYP